MLPFVNRTGERIGTRGRTFGATVIVVVAAFVLGRPVCLLRAADADRDDRISARDSIRNTMDTTLWRDRPQAGTNTLYLQLRFLGYEESYSTFRSRLPDQKDLQSLTSLTEVGRQLGFPLVPVKLTVAELRRTRMPIVVHMEADGLESGYFSLLYAVDDRIAQLIEGPPVRNVTLPLDYFRRTWTSYALVPQPPHRWWPLARRTTAFLLAASALLLLVREKARAARSLAPEKQESCHS